MPCTDGGPSYADIQEEAFEKKFNHQKSKLDEVTRLLCAVGHQVLNGFPITDNEKEELSTWLKKHAKEDEKRIALEKAVMEMEEKEQEKQRLKKIAEIEQKKKQLDKELKALKK